MEKTTDWGTVNGKWTFDGFDHLTVELNILFGVHFIFILFYNAQVDPGYCYCKNVNQDCLWNWYMKVIRDIFNIVLYWTIFYHRDLVLHALLYFGNHFMVFQILFKRLYRALRFCKYFLFFLVSAMLQGDLSAKTMALKNGPEFSKCQTLFLFSIINFSFWASRMCWMAFWYATMRIDLPYIYHY